MYCRNLKLLYRTNPSKSGNQANLWFVEHLYSRSGIDFVQIFFSNLNYYEENLYGN